MANNSNPILEEMEKQEISSVSTGFHARATLSLGYAFFAEGVTAESVFFPFTVGDKAGQEKAKADCAAAASQYGKSPSKVISLAVHRESVKVRTVTWQKDQVKITASWMPKKWAAWMKAIADLNITKFGTMWVHIAIVPDPDGRVQKDNQGNARPETFWIVDTIYPSEAACNDAAIKANAEIEEASHSAVVYPEGWSAELWSQYSSQVLADCGSFAMPLVMAASAKWGIPAEWLLTHKS